MRSVLCLIAFLLVSAWSGRTYSAVDTHEQAGAPAQRETANGPRDDGIGEQTESVAQAERLMSGDTVKVAVFEMVNVSDDRQFTGPTANAAAPLPASYFQRLDLSGDYVVQQDGRISMPRLGFVAATGRALQDVREEIQSSFTQVMGTAAEVNLTIVKRQPIYVVGAVKNSGAYDYAPGMIAIQAISLAGGIDRGAGRSAQLLERLRGAEKLEQTRAGLKRLIAKKARLETERDGASTIAVPARLKELAGSDEAERLIRDETELLHAGRRARAATTNDLDQQIESTEKHLAQLRQRADHFDAQKESRSTRIDLLQSLQQRGGVVQSSLITAQNELSDIEGRKQDFWITVAQTEQKLEAVRNGRAKFETDTMLSLSRELAQTTAEISDAERTLNVDAHATSTLNAMSGPEGLSEFYATPALDIIRRLDNTRSVMPAEDTTELLPGDVVRVRLVSPRAPSKGGLNAR
ncbi:polysaccharide biosynthesis/export family protein [Hyphomicrobium sp.]|uniref:polysaccharide biosynthesis/export family protein n=1 Tax=Hyphomicrobium sp. TaxID=82 RepID=UPI002E332DBF|nr:polysaccharide biosynthesis/export family protein [Hyphomicrobium sp.]HEX2839976.1 polysaccharide biosynthesis/export family protein [Hyphomicrobium sp.]